MEAENVECRSSKFRTCSQVSDTKSYPTVLGEAKNSCRKLGADEVAIGGENCRRGNTATSKQCESTSIDGKVIDQLASEVEKEISYHESQVHDLKSRLKELRKLSGELEKTNNSD